MEDFATQSLQRLTKIMVMLNRQLIINIVPVKLKL